MIKLNFWLNYRALYFYFNRVLKSPLEEEALTFTFLRGTLKHLKFTRIYQVTSIIPAEI